MKIRRNKYVVICSLIVTLAVIGLAVSALGFSSAFAVAGLLKDFGPLKETVNEEMYELTLSSGNDTGFHTHPGPAFVIVAKGTLTEDRGCGRIERHEAGSAFQEETGAVHDVRNEGGEAVKLYVFQIVPLNTPDFTPAPPPLCGN
jgi:quercetin dioxygenase-like cupin family protein